MKTSTAAPVPNMPTTTTTTTTSSRRQPARSARSSTTRSSNYYARPSSYAANAPPAQQNLEPPPATPPGFFPAITHFTDGLAALPKEVMRHFTLIKETEGKAHLHNQAIGEIIDAINKLPNPPNLHSSSHQQPILALSISNSLNGSAAPSIVDGSLPGTQQPFSETTDSTHIVDEHSETRRRAFLRLRESLKASLGILDEKNMVFSSANDTLSRQLARLDNVMPYVENEVSEEARLGSTTHWALPHMRELRKASGAASNDRSRRDVQAANSLAAAASLVHEGDIAATRSEARREALLAKRRANADSDFDDRPPAKRTPAGAKARKLQDASLAADGKPATSGQAPKRRRVEKAGAAAMERSISAATNGRGAAAAQRDRDPAEPAPRKKARANVAASGPKKRGPATSPPAASSPTRGTFATSTASKEPPTGSQTRPTNARGRQNSGMSIKSTAANDPVARNRRPSVTSVKAAPNNTSVSAAESRVAAAIASRTAGDTRTAAKETYPTADGNVAIEQEGMLGALVVEQPTPKGSLKREETEPADDGDTPTAAPFTQRAETAIAPIPVTTATATTNRSRGGSRATKPNTPVETPAATSAPDTSTATSAPAAAQHMSRSRSTRGANNPTALRANTRTTNSPTSGPPAASPRQRAANKRTTALYADSARTSPGTSGDDHPQASTAGGAGGANASKADAKDASSATGDADAGDVDEEIDPAHDLDGMSSPGSDEPRYCVCNGPSYGHMVGCDNPDCPREWFHLACLGMTRFPGARTKWYCDECKELLRKKGSAAGSSR